MTAIARPTTRSSETNAFSPFIRLPAVVEVAPRVAALGAVVAEHEDGAVRHHDVELDLRRIGRYPVGSGVQIGRLVQRLSVHGDPTLGVTADDMVTGQPDGPLDQVLGAGVGQHADELQGLADRPALLRRRAGQPAAGVLEHHDLAAFGGGQLLDQDPVADLQGVLHRDRGDHEHLPDETPKQRGNDHRADDDGQQLLEEGQDVTAEGEFLGITGLESSVWVIRLVGCAGERSPGSGRLPPISHREAAAQLASRFSLILAALPRRPRR